MQDLYLGIEHLVFSAFIELNHPKSEEIVSELSFELLEKYGKELCKKWEKNTGMKAYMILSRNHTINFFRNYDNFFEETKESCVAVKNNVGYEDLIEKFNTYIPFEFLEICNETHEYLENLYLKEKIDKQEEILFINIEDIIANLFIELNSIGREEKVGCLSLEFILQYAKKLTKNFNRKYLRIGKKIILTFPEDISQIVLEDDNYFFINSQKIYLNEHANLEQLIQKYRSKVPLSFIKEIKEDGMNIITMYNEYLFDKNCIKKDRKYNT